MPQAKLPDTNAAWVRYRNFGLESIRQKDYAGASGAIFEINALLPTDYRVEIDTAKYNALDAIKITFTCKACLKEIEHIGVKEYELALPLLSSFITQQQTETCWDCPLCKHTNRLLTTNIIKESRQKPVFYKVIREPPNRQQGILDRVSFHNGFTKWFYESLSELDHQLGKYRDEYRPLDEDETAHEVEGGEEQD